MGYDKVPMWSFKKAPRALAKVLARPQVRRFLQALPAIVAVGATLVVVLLVRQTPPGEVRAAYASRAAAAALAKDHDTATVCWQRLAQSSGEVTPEYVFHLALSLREQKKDALALGLMRSLAQPTAAGHPPAHLWLARAILKGDPQRLADLRDAEMHLRWVLQADADSRLANALLAQLLTNTGRPGEAVAHFQAIVAHQPEFHLNLALAYEKLAKHQKMREQADLAAAHFSQRAKSKLDDHAARVFWAESLRLKGDFPAAVKVLQEGMTIRPDLPYRQALAQVYAAQAAALQQEAPKRLPERLTLLAAALQGDANNPLALQQLVTLMRTEAKEAEQARALLEPLLAKGNAPALLHLLLGNEACRLGRLEEARRHFEQAYGKGPKMAVAANNLAWILAHQEPVDMTRALQLIDSVLERWPKVATFRDTRGHILVRMERWKEALAELEASLPGLTDRRPSHEALALVYDRLGIPTMAAQHRRLAKATPTQK